MNIISSGFIGDCKVGDNINYNLAVLGLLYTYQKINTQNKILLNKPITIIIISIIEVLLYYFSRQTTNGTESHVKRFQSHSFVLCN